MAEIILNHLTKTYPTASGRSVTVVRGIDLAIKDREFMVLVGPSGCGKSTTLRMIAGLEDISGGTITIGDRVVNDIAPKDRDIAMVFQNYALYPHMSVYDNMAFGLTLRKMPKPEIKRRVNEAAAMLGLTDYLGRKPKDLSGGQRQRVAVGRAIVRQPKVFLFDEPLSNLDAKMRGTMRGELARLHARLDATMVYVTHDQVEAMTMGDRICVMHDGAIMQVATPLELYEHPANLFVAGFIGSPPMNLFTGIVRTIGGVLVFTETGAHAKPLVLPLPAECSRRAQPYLDRPVTLGLRPEHLSESGGPEKVPLNATVELVEPMGADTTVHLTTGATSFIARVQPATRLALGQAVTLHLDLAHAHLFDASTGQALA